MSDRFRARYGPWAVVAGASEGLGEAFARALAARGVNLILLARRGEVVAALGEAIARERGVEVRAHAIDLGRRDLVEAMAPIVDGLEVGLLVYNAARSTIGPFLDEELASQLEVVDVNCRGPIALAHLLGGPMAARGRGGIVLLTSLAGGQGSPWLSAYAASKAFDLVLAEGLWGELGGRGVDVLACRAGAVRTPGYERTRPAQRPPLMEAGPVAEEALAALGRGPVVVPGFINRVGAWVLKLLPRRWAIGMMASQTRKLYPHHIERS